MIYIDYGAPPFGFTGPWECDIDGSAVRQELPLAGFFDDESTDWHPVCDACAGSDSAQIQHRLNHRADVDLDPDDGRAPRLRRLAMHDWVLRTAGFEAKGMWLLCSNGHWFPRPMRADETVQASFTDSRTGQRTEQIMLLARCPECPRWVGVPELF